MFKFTNSIRAYIYQQKISLAVISVNKLPIIDFVSCVSGNLEGLMKDKQMVDTVKAQVLVKTLIDKLHCKKRRLNVADLCLPDNCFFSRVIKIPLDKLKDTDIAQYIHQKADELLPSSVKDLRIRWQIIEKDKEALVLMVGVDRKHLDPVLDVFSQNHLLVRQAKPMSFVLADLIVKLGETAFLMQIYQNGDLTTVAYYQKAVIFATCITVSVQDLNAAVLQAEADKARQFAISLLGTVKLEKIWLVGFRQNGINIAKSYQPKDMTVACLEDHITPKTKTALTPMMASLVGFSYSNADQMNFVTRQQQSRFKHLIFFHNVYNSFYVFAVMLLFPLAVLAFFSLNLFYNQKIQEAMLSSAKNSRITNQAKAVEAEAAKINQKTQILENLFNQKTASAQILNEIGSLIPAGVKVTSFSYPLEKKTVHLRGTAYSRGDLLTFQNNLKKIGTVSLPITSFVRQKDLPFEVVITLPK